MGGPLDSSCRPKVYSLVYSHCSVMEGIIAASALVSWHKAGTTRLTTVIGVAWQCLSC